MARTSFVLNCLLVFASAVWHTGCGPAKSQVNGKVTLDGQPLANGAISFEPADGQGQPDGIALQNGAYSLETAPGKKRVQLTASKVTGQKRAFEEDPNSRLMDIVEPIEFTVAEPVEFELPAGKTTKDFTLSTKK